MKLLKKNHHGAPPFNDASPMKPPLFLAILCFVLVACGFGAKAGRPQSAQAPRPMVQQDGSAPTQNAPFDALKELATAFPHAITTKRNGHVLEFCPDGTCDGFAAPGDMPEATLRDFAYLYEYFFSGYTFLDQWRARQGAKDAAQRALAKSEYQDCRRDTPRDAARCVLATISRTGRVRLIFVRYDEGERHVVPVNLAKQLAER